MQKQFKFTGKKTQKVQRLILRMIEIFESVGLPIKGTDRRLEKMAMACLAVGDISSHLSQAKSGVFLKSRDIITFENTHFGENISYGSYDDIRRKDLALPVEAGIVISSSNVESQAVNNPTRGYSLAPHFAELIKTLANAAKKEEQEALEKFKAQHQEIVRLLAEKRELDRVPVTLPSGEMLSLSAGEHNQLQKAIIEEFLPRFGQGAILLYVGDTEDKYLFRADKELKGIGFFELKHEELPDVVAYSKDKNLLYLIEAVHSAGPMSEMRVNKLKRQLECCSAEAVYITAFNDKTVFKRWLSEIAWETEVWIASEPEHMIHFNGYKFLEIHK